MNEAFDELIEKLASFELDPLGFALWAFPWGEPGTPLEDEQLEDWQYEYLDKLGKQLRAAVAEQALNDEIITPIQMERSTGHGVGKSALVAILILWGMSTLPDTKGFVTANTETQLRTKTWPEVSKWHRMFIARELFEVKATALFPRDEDHAKTWRFDCIPWSEKNPEAFAGMHNMGRRILMIFDEGSAIKDIIWETAEGATTDRNTQIIWGAFGNPTMNIGRFRENAPDGKFGRRWDFEALDSRSVRRTNKKKIQEWIDDYGEDHDFVRVRVKGIFPRVDAVSFIPYDLAKQATLRELPESANSSDVLLGVDVARFGTNSSVIYPRQGRDARSRPPRVFQGLSTTELAFKVREAVWELNPTTVFVDEGGVGGGVLDQLNLMRLPCLVIGVQFGSRADGFYNEKAANKRAEMYIGLRQWLKIGCIPERVRGIEHTLIDDMTAATYTLTFGKDEIQLERKADMVRRGAPSPDATDALALTFAMPIPEILRDRFGREIEVKQPDYDYDPLEAI